MDAGPHGPDVAWCGMEWDFWTLPEDRPADAAFPGCTSRGCEAEVGEDDVWVVVLVDGLADEDILRLDVAVDDVLPGLPVAKIGAVVALVNESGGFCQLEIDVPKEALGDLELVVLVVRRDNIVEVAAGAVLEPENSARG